MDVLLQPEILKVQKFSRFARACCLVMMGAIVLGVILLAVAAGKDVSVNMGPYSAPSRQLGPVGMTYAVIGFLAVLAIVFRGLLHLYSLFNNLARGGIYTSENVRHIRQLGLLALTWAVLGIVLPVGSIILVQAGLVDKAVVTMKTQLVFGSTNIPSFINAGLILLASWIMEVGRKTQDEADRMRREAELVV